MTGQRYDVDAFAVEVNDPVLTGLRCPWTIRRTTAGPWEFYVDTTSAAFRSITLTPLDALLIQLAWLIADFERGQGSRSTFPEILTALREKYATASLLNPQVLVSEALAQLVDISRSIVGRVSVEDARAFFDGLSPSRQESIRVAMARPGFNVSVPSDWLLISPNPPNSWLGCGTALSTLEAPSNYLREPSSRRSVFSPPGTP